jgi:ubiquinone/menaquinone biosynthesis C-methylase UbiE
MDRTRETAAAEGAADFKAFEADGWTRQAESYGRFSGRMTNHSVQALLDAAGVESDMRVLDLGCGPGQVAAAAAGRGAAVTGADIAEGMLAVARRRHPEVSFVHGDAESLPFPEGFFDAVVGNFVLNHLPRPELAAAEIARVLARSGRAALTVWERKDRMRLFAIFDEAFERAGISDENSDAEPPGEDPFRFAAEPEFRSLFTGAGLEEVQIEDLAWDFEVESPEEVWEGFLGGSVRSTARVRVQPPDVQERIRSGVITLAEAYRGRDGLELPCAAKLGSARRP